ncbi:MAG: hypothetical protein O4965_25505 [Trichodesmium sp. St19_bin1]|nr:hypothetical protein [Trichodesmium sp. St19_bin1]
MLSCLSVHKKKYISRGWSIRNKKNGQVSQYKTTAKVAAACEMQTRREATV